MYGRIEYQGKVYYSYIFAYFKYDYMTHYIVYDSTNNKFEIVTYLSKEYGGHRQVGLMEESEKDFIEKDKMIINKGEIDSCKGYPWLINNIDLIIKIEEGKEVEEEYIKIAKELNDTIDVDAWNEVVDEDSARYFMDCVCAFHDWYIIGMNAQVKQDDELTTLQLKFNSQGPFDCVVEFEGDIYINIAFSSASRIYLSSVIFKDEYIYWVDGDEELSYESFKESKFRYISSNKLRWKYVAKEINDW